MCVKTEKFHFGKRCVCHYSFFGRMNLENDENPIESGNYCLQIGCIECPNKQKLSTQSPHHTPPTRIIINHENNCFKKSRIRRKWPVTHSEMDNNRRVRFVSFNFIPFRIQSFKRNVLLTQQKRKYLPMSYIHSESHMETIVFM